MSNRVSNNDSLCNSKLQCAAHILQYRSAGSCFQGHVIPYESGTVSQDRRSEGLESHAHTSWNILHRVSSLFHVPCAGPISIPLQVYDIMGRQLSCLSLPLGVLQFRSAAPLNP